MNVRLNGKSKHGNTHAADDLATNRTPYPVVVLIT